MARKCPDCGAATSTESEICQGCGASLSDEEPADNKPISGLPADRGLLARGASRSKWIVIVVLFLIIGSIMVVLVAQDGDQEATPRSFTVYGVKGSYYYALDSKGAVAFYGASATVVIQRALNSLTLDRTWKEKVLIQGDFTIDAPLLVQSNTLIQLDGGIALALGVTSNLISAYECHDIEVVGGTWSSSIYIAEPSLYFKDCRNITISDCEFVVGGVAVSDCAHVLIANNSVHDIVGELRQAILVHNSCSDVEVAHNVIANSSGGGIYIFQRNDGTAKTAEDVWVHNNTLTSIRTDGISLYPEGSINRCQRCTVENNTIMDAGNSGTHTAIAIGWGGGAALGSTLGCDHNTIRGNTIVRSHTLTLGGYLNVRGDHNLVIGNNIINAQKTAMLLLHAENNTLESNSVEGTELDWANAITVTGSSNNTIRNNQLLNPSNCCIQLQTSAYGVASSFNIVAGNTMDSPRVCWVLINETANTGNQIIDNDLRNPSASYPTGIVDIGTNTMVARNTIFP